MVQRTVVITGANAGIGKETAVALASAGDRVVMACRSPERAEAALAEVRQRSGSDAVEVVPLDLASFASVRAASDRLHDRCERIDVLVNNAGVIMSERTTTVDGFETTFGVNHLGHFLLTSLVGDLVEAAPSARVVNLSSVAHWWAAGGLDFEDLQSIRLYSVWLAYGRSKLANLLFTTELSRRWRDAGVSVSAVHPGHVASGFGTDGDTRGGTRRLIDVGARYLAIPPDQGADTVVWLATSPAGADLERSGTYWFSRRPARRAPWATRLTDAARLWRESEQLVETVTVA